MYWAFNKQIAYNQTLHADLTRRLIKISTYAKEKSKKIE